MFSFHLLIHPLFLMVEDFLFSHWPKSVQRTWSKNLERTLLTGFAMAVCMSLGNKGDKFISLTGALTCTPAAFTLPALFHLELCASTRWEKVMDLSIISISIYVFVFATTQSLVNW